MLEGNGVKETSSRSDASRLAVGSLMRAPRFHKTHRSDFRDFLIIEGMAKNADLKAHAATKILTGGLSDVTLNAIIKLPSNGEDVVIRAVDITVSGAIKDHVTTKEEVIKFMARSGSDYDQLKAEIEEAKDVYEQQTDRAGKARMGKAAKQAKNDNVCE